MLGLSCLRGTARLATGGAVVTFPPHVFAQAYTEIRVLDESEQMSRHFT